MPVESVCELLGRHQMGTGIRCSRCGVKRTALPQPKLDLMRAWLVQRQQGASESWLWWGPDCKNYTSELLKAGLYTQDKALELERSRVGHVAVPLAGELRGLRCGTLGEALGLPTGGV